MKPYRKLAIIGFVVGALAFAATPVRAATPSTPLGKLDKAWNEALMKGWTVVDMKKDWKRIFSFEEAK